MPYLVGRHAKGNKISSLYRAWLKISRPILLRPLPQEIVQQKAPLLSQGRLISLEHDLVGNRTTLFWIMI